MVNWDDATDKKMLLNIIHVTAPNPPKWEQIAASMGEGYTGEAVRGRYKKLKAQAQAQFGDAPTPAEGGAKTPAKRGGKKAAGEPGSKSGSKRKASKKDAEEGEVDDEEASPSKKVKTEQKDESENEA